MKRPINSPITLAALLLLLVSSPAFGEGGERERLLSEDSHKRLSAIHQLMEEGKPGEAVSALTALVPLVKDSAYEAAVVHQSLGYAYIALNEYQKAITSFESALSLSVLPDAVALRIRYDLAQLYFTLEQYPAGIEVLERWLTQAQNPPPDAHAMAASGYIALKRFREAVPHLSQAIAASASPEEAWYQSLLAIYYDLEEYGRAVEILKIMIASFPDRSSYWKQLAGLYRITKEEPKALSTLALAHKKGFLDGEGMIDLANLYLHEDIPLKAGFVLEEGLRNGNVLSTTAHWERLSSIWLQARERGRALVPLKKAGSSAENGRFDFQRGVLLSGLKRWDEAAEALTAAIAKGGVDDLDRAQILLGIADQKAGNRKEPE